MFYNSNYEIWEKSAIYMYIVACPIYTYDEALFIFSI